MSEKHTKKQKKLAQLLANRRTQRIIKAEEEHALQRDLEKEREEDVKKASLASSRSAAAQKKKQAEPAWSARVQQIRDKNTGQMRDAKSKWNRFAGTESGGGLGL